MFSAFSAASAVHLKPDRRFRGLQPDLDPPSHPKGQIQEIRDEPTERGVILTSGMQFPVFAAVRVSKNLAVPELDSPLSFR